MKMILCILVLAAAAAVSACQGAAAPFDTGCAFDQQLGKCNLSNGNAGTF